MCHIVHRPQPSRHPLLTPMPSFLSSTSNGNRPTQRHMHNYSLPSTFQVCTALYPIPRPARCRSSPSLSQFREAVYIPGSSRIQDVQADDSSERSQDTLRRNNPSSTTLITSHSSSPTCFRERAATPSLISRSPSSMCRPSTSLSGLITRKTSNLSLASVSSLPFPLPDPPGLGANTEWEIDVFAPYSSSIDSVPQSRWSPASSLSSLTQLPTCVDNGYCKTDRTTSRIEIKPKSSPMKLKAFLGRLSLHRAAKEPSFHAARQMVHTDREVDSRAPNVAMTDEYNTFIDGETVDGLADDLVYNITSPNIDVQNDDAKIVKANIYPGCVNSQAGIHANDFARGLLSNRDTAWRDTGHAETVFPSSTRSTTDPRLVSAQTSNHHYMNVDGIVTDIPSVGKTFPSGCFHASPVSSPSLPSNTLAGRHTRNKPSSNSLRALRTGPSPLTPPPSPQRSPPSPVANHKFLDTDHQPESTLAHYSASFSPPPGRVTEMWLRTLSPPPPEREICRPLSPQASPLQAQKNNQDFFTSQKPVIPPRSKLRPPPVKIPTRTSVIEAENTQRCCLSSSNGSLPMDSPASSIRTISPLPTPPIHFGSSSNISSTQSHSSHAASLDSSDFIISPMPTPPHSPKAFTPCARTITSEPGVNQHSRRSPSDSVGPRLRRSDHAITPAHPSSNRKSSIRRPLIPEFASQEEPRSPPSRISFYESPPPSPVSSESDIDDDAMSVYSHFSSAYYTSRRRPSRHRRVRSVRRSGSKGRGRATGQMAPMSMTSIYSQASFCSPVDQLLVSPLPQSTGGVEDDVTDNELVPAVFEASTYPYAHSRDDYSGRALKPSVPALRSPMRSGVDFEPRPPLSRREKIGDVPHNDQWRDVLDIQRKANSTRRTSSNVSVVGHPIGVNPRQITKAPAIGIIHEFPPTSTPPTSPIPLVPNRRKQTNHHRFGPFAPSTPSLPTCTIPHPPPNTWMLNGSSNPSEISLSKVPLPQAPLPAKPNDVAPQTGSGLRGMKKHLSSFRNLMSFSFSRSQSSPSPTSSTTSFHKAALHSDRLPPLLPMLSPSFPIDMVSSFSNDGPYPRPLGRGGFSALAV
ncbi:hypothetical protein R3P38DRAFT_2823070 [Favolaschia claudopus]|uniref:Uncharacterized protein n=1 Tax=Favolaschia claudopus TaxID=2862362 RepID=A0AAW0EI47_9AGAR